MAIIRGQGGPQPLFDPAVVQRVLATSRNPYAAKAPSHGLFDQFSDVIGGLIPGAVNMGAEAAQSVVGAGRYFKDVGGNILAGRNPGAGFSGDFGENAREYLPLLESFRSSFADTGERLRHPMDYAKAVREGTIVPTLVQDIGNAAIVAGPAVKALTAASGVEAGAAEAAASPGAKVAAAGAKEAGGSIPEAVSRAAAEGPAAPARFAPRLPASFRASPGALVDEQVARPGVLRVAQAAERVARPVEQIGFAPAKIFDVPARAIFGKEGVPVPFLKGEEGAPVTVGVRNALQRFEPVQRFEQGLVDKAAARAQKSGTLDILRGGEADKADELTRAGRIIIGQAGDVVGHDPNMMHAVTILQTTAPIVDYLRQVEPLIKKAEESGVPDARQIVLGHTFQIDQVPTPETLKLVEDYRNPESGMDPQVRAKLDKASELIREPIDWQTKQKLEGNGRQSALHPDQLRHQAVTSAVEAELAKASKTALENARAAQQPMFDAENPPAPEGPPTLFDKPTGDVQTAGKPVEPAGPRWEPPVGVRPQERGAPSTAAERAQVRQDIDSLVSRATDAQLQAQAELEAAIGERGLPNIPPAKFKGGKTTNDRLAEGRTLAQSQADWGRTKKVSGYDWVAKLGDEEKLLVKRHMNPDSTTTPDNWFGDSAEAARVADMSPEQIVGEVLHRMKVNESLKDIAAGHAPRWPDEVRGMFDDNELTMLEGLPSKGKAAVNVNPRMVEAWRDGQRAQFDEEASRMLPRNRTGLPRPHQMTRDEYVAEVSAIGDRMSAAEKAGAEPAPSDMNRLDEMIPEAVIPIPGEPPVRDVGEFHDRVVRLAEALGEDVPPRPETATAVPPPPVEPPTLGAGAAEPGKPNLRAYLETGPIETAPGAYKPVLLHFSHAVEGLNKVADLVGEKSGPAAGAEFRALIPDAMKTVDEIVGSGFKARYLPGVAEVEGGPRGSGGGRDQLPYNARTMSEHQKVEGTVPKDFQAVLKGFWREASDMTRNKSQALIEQDFGKGGQALLDEWYNAGVTPNGEPMTRGVYQSYVDKGMGSKSVHNLMERNGYSSWSTTTPQTRVAPGRVNVDTVFLPSRIVKEYERWWSHLGDNPMIHGYDVATRVFKHSVLALSPRWHVWNVIGNAFMASFGAGESPLALVRAVRELRRTGAEQGVAYEGTSRLGRWTHEVGQGMEQLPNRLKGAGQASEALGHLSVGKEPGWFGRNVLNRSYATNQFVDDLTHSAVYLAKKAKGYSDETAAELSLRAVGDFQKMNWQEREIVRRIFPFYAWMKHVAVATSRLSVEHPYRVAWLAAMAHEFSNPENVPPSMRGAVGVGDWMFNLGQANPYEGSVGSIFNRPDEIGGQILRSVNPVIKVPVAALTGLSLDKAAGLTRPPGSGNLTPYGNPALTPMLNPFDPGSIPQGLFQMGRYAGNFIPAAREAYLAKDTALGENFKRYDTGAPQVRNGRPVPVDRNADWQIINDFLRNLGVPFTPSYLDQRAYAQQSRQGMIDAARARARYQRSVG